MTLRLATKEGVAVYQALGAKAEQRVWLKLEDRFLRFYHLSSAVTKELREDKAIKTIDLATYVAEVDVLHSPARLRLRSRQGGECTLLHFDDPDALKAWRHALRDSYDNMFFMALDATKQQAMSALAAASRDLTLRAPTLLKYLVAHDFDQSAAFNALRDTEVFRQQVGARSATEEYVHKLFTEEMIVFPGTFDYEGRPLLILRSAKHFPNQHKFIDVLQLVLYLLEKASDMMITAHQVVVIEQLINTKRTNSDPRMVKFLVELHQWHFPDVVGEYYAVNAPWYYPIIFSVVKPWLTKDLANKVHVYTNVKGLTKHMNAASLPEDLDGQLAYSASEMSKRLRSYDYNAGGSHRLDNIILDLYDDVPATERSKSAILSETIKKQGSWVKLYNRRFVILTHHILYYYKSKNDPMPEGALRLKGANIESVGSQFTLRTTEGKAANFQTDSEQACDHWVRAIRATIGKL